jgi:hypothetical protein
MPQWEYNKIDLNSIPANTRDLDVLNRAGQQGWELVSITRNNVAYFKRLVEATASTPTSRRTASS